MIELLTVIAGWALTVLTLAYGCAKVEQGSIGRWLVFLAAGVVATQFGWLPLLPFLGLRVTAADQYMAVVLATVGLKLLMERALPWLLWSVDVEEVSE
jgi:hypothetical protein